MPGWRQIGLGWRTADTGANITGPATSLANGCTLDGALIVGTGKSIQLQGSAYIALADGTNPQPVIRFASEPTLGCYRPQAGQWNFTAAGSAPFQIRQNAIAAIQGLMVESRVEFWPETVKTADYPVTGSDLVIIMNVAAGGTLTLEAAPVDGKLLCIRNLSGNSLTVARNGKLIDGAAANLTIPTVAARIIVYHSTAGSWYTLAGIG